MFFGVFMIAAYRALLKTYPSALCATAAMALIAWFLADHYADRLFGQGLSKTHELNDLKWTLFIALAFILEAVLYLSWRVLRYYTSTVVQLRKAIRADKLDVHYQPIVDSRKGYLVGAESHSRWRPKGAAIVADAFISAAEKSELICELTRSVMRRVAEDYSTYLWACKDFFITINLTAHDLLDQTFPDFVAGIMTTYNIPPSAIVFEINDSALLNHKGAATQLHRLRVYGHRIAMGNVGTSSFRHAFNEPALPVHALARRYFQCPANIRCLQ
jgi:sensor c-di-GMP phosphodiesterase-like protein